VKPLKDGSQQNCQKRDDRRGDDHAPLPLDYVEQRKASKIAGLRGRGDAGYSLILAVLLHFAILSDMT
jgi:hypothetical protein